MLPVKSHAHFCAQLLFQEDWELLDKKLLAIDTKNHLLQSHLLIGNRAAKRRKLHVATF